MRTRKFYDFSIHTAPECEGSPEAMAETAAGYGYAGIAITNHTPHHPQEPEMTDHPKIAVYSGIEIVAKNPHHLRQMIQRYRPRVSVLSVHGGNEKINRAAVESPAVDILSHPDERLNHVLMRFASENRVAIEFNLDSIIRMRGRARVRALTNFRHNLKLARKYGAPMILASNAQSIYDLRAPREMIALGGVFGMTEDEAIAAISAVPEEILRRGSENWVMEGVWIVTDD
ncbi:MAG: ribonuclease P protein component 3 [Candidatus Methanogaster sp.]|uniref:Ribonuclease P protein component 3 n=1 Tax=Candidatus Methanogaster sp. TaxID=3386292 RepID=A0AC61L4D7_9EURY|nr:MAG: ribonuclease P protein component 3 [ANME-2 cluster archaeon]